MEQKFLDYEGLKRLSEIVKLGSGNRDVISFKPTKPSSGNKTYYVRIPRAKVSGILTYYSEYSTSATGAIIMQRYNGFISLETNAPYIVGSSQLSAYYDSTYIYIYYSVMATRYNQKIYLFADNIQNSGAELVETKPSTTTMKNYNLSQFVINNTLGKLASITVPAETTTIFCNIGYDNYSTTVDGSRVKSPYTHITTENRRLDLMFSQSKVYVLSDEDNLMSKMTFKNNLSDSNSYEFVITCDFDEETVLYVNSPYDTGEFYSGYEPEGFTNVMEVIDLTDIGSIAAVIPDNASSSNKLVAQYTPRSEYSINNSSANDTWYKVGRYTGGNRSSRLDLISDRVDGQTFESSIRISGVGTNSNYVSWIGEDGCENSVNAVQIDSNYNLYIKLKSYSAVRIIAYGNFESFDYEALQSSPSGSNIPLQKLVTKSDISYLSRDKLMYHQETGAAVLYLAAYNWNLPINNTYVVRVTACDKNSITDNYDGIVKFTYGGTSSSITNVTHVKLSGTGTIDATNNSGTIQFSFSNGLPEICVEFLG